MKYEELVSILSQARIGKYFRVAKGNKQRTLQLYHHNLKLSQRLFGVIGMFEIALRNAIHNHYSQQFNDKDWIVNSTAPGKLLAYDAKNTLKKAYTVQTRWLPPLILDFGLTFLQKTIIG